MIQERGHEGCWRPCWGLCPAPCSYRGCLYPGRYGLGWEEPIPDISKQLPQQHPEWTSHSSHLQLCRDQCLRAPAGWPLCRASGAWPHLARKGPWALSAGVLGALLLGFLPKEFQSMRGRAGCSEYPSYIETCLMQSTKENSSFGLIKNMSSKNIKHNLTPRIRRAWGRLPVHSSHGWV